MSFKEFALINCMNDYIDGLSTIDNKSAIRDFQQLTSKNLENSKRCLLKNPRISKVDNSTN